MRGFDFQLMAAWRLPLYASGISPLARRLLYNVQGITDDMAGTCVGVPGWQCTLRVCLFLFHSIPVFDWASINGSEGNIFDVCAKENVTRVLSRSIK